ncbi:MAG: DUF502 domain-containing protein [Candidatus Babeliaceae bacterium]|nr:DUF502 domain-containing protein [Candidatus Babeliaceae bacterium]
MHHQRKIRKGFGATIKSLFISGLLTILPLVLTYALFKFLFKTLKYWLSPLFDILPPLLKAIPFSEFLIAIIAIIFIGAILKLFFLNKLIEYTESLFKKIPLISQVYMGIKQLVQALGPKEKDHFQRVVLVEFPRRGSYTLGFLTSETHSELVPKAYEGAGFYNVFVPHTPNPTGGFFILVPAAECIETNLTRQEAMTIIISGGIIQPERLDKKSDS